MKLRYTVAMWPKEIEPVIRAIEQIVGRVRLRTGGDFFVQEIARDRGESDFDMSNTSTVLGAVQYVRGLFKDGTGFSVRGVVSADSVFIVEELVIIDVPVGDDGTSPRWGHEEYVFSEPEIDRLNKELQT